MAPNWKADEIALACQAYASATNNGIQGADQDIEAFCDDIVKKLEQLVPRPESIQDNTYHKRGHRVYFYLRDNVFKEINKFNKALRIVDSSHPTGVNLSQKLSMAVAIHLGFTKKMDYYFKDLKR